MYGGINPERVEDDMSIKDRVQVAACFAGMVAMIVVPFMMWLKETA